MVVWWMERWMGLKCRQCLLEWHRQSWTRRTTSKRKIMRGCSKIRMKNWRDIVKKKNWLWTSWNSWRPRQSKEEAKRTVSMQKNTNSWRYFLEEFRLNWKSKKLNEKSSWNRQPKPKSSLAPLPKTLRQSKKRIKFWGKNWQRWSWDCGRRKRK